MTRKKKKKNNLKIKIITILFIILMVYLIYTRIQTNEATQVSALTNSLFETVEKSSTVNVTEYVVYGTHFNVEGNIEIPDISGIYIDKVEVIAKDIHGTEIIINSEYEYEENLLSFSTKEMINQGLDLESLTNSNYYIFLKVTFSNSEIKYYSLNNSTDYENIKYYTLTRNNVNNEISIDFGTHSGLSYLGLEVSKINELPENVYDVVIDPGHGGRDSGATNEDYYEADIVLDCANILKEQLEEMELKVLLTRDGTEPEDENTAYNMYDEDGRITIANESKAKILISLHMNSNSASLSSGGVEVYAPSNCDLTLASLFADNIVELTNTNYSSLESYYKEADGVYVRNYTEYEILSSNRQAAEDGYEEYNLTTDTPYLYVIREIGGIITNAFVDGRNTYYGANKYVDSNIGIEGYLIELGYMSIEEDLNNVLENEATYMRAISESIKTFYNLN